MTQSLVGPMPLPERAEYIKKLLEGPKPSGTSGIEFRGKQVYLPIYTVPLDLPVSRLGNGRTLAAQQEFIATHGKPDDFFTRDPDSAEALQAQHELLFKMKDDAGLFARLKKMPQNIPLVLTEEGYVVNGNRRLCCFRTLFVMDSTKYAHFGNVDVVFLPHCTPKDIDELEALEQIVPDTKAGYSWLTEAMLVRERQQAHGLTLKQVAKFYKKSESRATEMLQMLDAADRYLESRGKAKLYSRLNDSKYAFKSLVGLRRELHDAEKEEVFTEAVYKLIDRDAKGDRIYAEIKKLYSNLDRLIETVQRGVNGSTGETEEPGEAGKSPEGTYASPEIQSFFGGQTSEDFSTGDLARRVADPSNHQLVMNAIQDAIDEQAELERQHQVQGSFMEKLQEAYTCLESAVTELNPESDLAGADECMANIETAVSRIRVKVAEYAAD